MLFVLTSASKDNDNKVYMKSLSVTVHSKKFKLAIVFTCLINPSRDLQLNAKWTRGIDKVNSEDLRTRSLPGNYSLNSAP